MRLKTRLYQALIGLVQATGFAGGLDSPMAKRRPGLFLIWRQAGVLCLLCCGCGKLPDNVPDSTEQMGLQCFQCARVGVKNGTVAAGADEIDDQVEHDLCVRPPDTVGCDQDVYKRQVPALPISVS